MSDVGTLEYITQFSEYKKGTKSGINVLDFDPEKSLEDKHNFFMTIYAKRRSGKSVFMKDFLERTKKWYTSCYVFSMTAEEQKDMYDFCPESNIYSGLNIERIEELIEQQKSTIRRLKAEQKQLERDGSSKKIKMPVMLLVLDDVISDPKMKTSPVLKSLATLSRHYHMAIILISQTIRAGVVPIEIRTNCDIAVSFLLDSEDDRKLFVEQYLSKISKKVGTQVYNEVISEPYQAIICAVCSTSPRYEDCVFKQISRLKVPKFMIGSNGDSGPLGPNKNTYKKIKDLKESKNTGIFGPQKGPNGSKFKIADSGFSVIPKHAMVSFKVK